MCIVYAWEKPKFFSIVFLAPRLVPFVPFDITTMGHPPHSLRLSSLCVEGKVVSGEEDAELKHTIKEGWYSLPLFMCHESLYEHGIRMKNNSEGRCGHD
jgi:hypothetical protein